MNKRESSLSPRIDHSDSREYQSIKNLPNMVTGLKILFVLEFLIFFSDVLEHTNNEEKHFRSTIFIHFNQNGLNNS
jgi:hypothetical protein